MIPVLYESDENAFDGLGIGVLAETITCKVTEVRNGEYEAQMTYPMSGKRFADLKVGRIILATPAYHKDAEPFRIYAIEKPINGIVTIYAEHITYQLSRIPVMPFTATSSQNYLMALVSNAADAIPFTFETDIVTAKNTSHKIPKSCRALLGGTEGSFIDTYGGEFEFVKNKVIIHRKRGLDRGVSIRYGKNLTDIRQEENISALVTAVCPYYADDNVTVTLPEKIIKLDGQRNHERTITKDFSGEFDTVPTVAQLRAVAEAWLNASENTTPKVCINVSFALLGQFEEYKDRASLEAVNLCDDVTVVFEDLGINAHAKVVKTVWDVIADRYESVQIGSITDSLPGVLTEQMQQQKQEIQTARTQMEKAIVNATDRITGVDGGYVVMHQDADGHPYELLVMDTADISTATKVWRWNKDGLGYSENGYDGPYGLAMTSDGQIVADYITTGELSASIIKAGILQDPTGKFILDMLTGSVKMASAEITGGSINIETASATEDKISMSFGNNKISLNPRSIIVANNSDKIRTLVNSTSMIVSNLSSGYPIMWLGKDYLAFYDSNGNMTARYDGNKLHKLGQASSTNSLSLASVPSTANSIMIEVSCLHGSTRRYYQTTIAKEMLTTSNQIVHIGGYYASASDYGFANVNITKTSVEIRNCTYAGTDYKGSANTKITVYYD